MCRWITLISSEHVSLSDVILAPSNSLVRQSRDATFHPGYGPLNNAPMNGDGFGVGWYHTNVVVCPGKTSTNGMHDDGSLAPLPSPTTLVIPVDNHGINSNQSRNHDYTNPEQGPGTSTKAAVFKDVFPAWNNSNLREICLATASNCIMAHVRAASKGSGISHQNCHPFKAGRLLFCHNGRIDNFLRVRRRLSEQLDDEAFAQMHGTTDSECVFGLILTYLAKDGHGSPCTQCAPFGPQRLVAALKKTLWRIERTLEEAGLVEGYSTCNFSLTDGATMVVTRFCDKSPAIPPPSLYFAFGDTATLNHELTSEQQQQQGAPLVSPKSDSTINQVSTSSSSNSEHGSSDSKSDTAVTVDADYGEQVVPIEEAESQPGKVLHEVNPETASFIVSSNPLTTTHTWHKMPRNSIMWCTRGAHPELRLLTRRKHRYSVGE
jgi:glutamine amidotransferase